LRTTIIWCAVGYGIYQLNHIIAYIVVAISVYLTIEKYIEKIRDYIQLQKWFRKHDGKAFFIFGRRNEYWNEYIENNIAPLLKVPCFINSKYSPSLYFEDLNINNHQYINRKIEKLNPISFPIIVKINNSDFKITNYKSLFDDLIKKRKNEKKFIEIMNKYA